MQRAANVEQDGAPQNGRAVSKEGYAFNPHSAYWQLNKDVTVSLGLANALPDPTRSGFRATLRRYAEEGSAGHAYNMAEKFKRYLRDTGAVGITAVDLLNWRSRLGDANQSYLGALKGFLISWHDYGFPGIPGEVIGLLNKWRIKGNSKGTAVTTADPETGPYTDLEIQGLLEWANMAVSSRKIRFADYAYFLTLLMTARRPSQIAGLRGKDLVEEGGDGSPSFRLNVPRVKQRGGRFRGSFRSLPIIEDLYVVLRHQHAESVALLERKLGMSLAQQKAEVPIFINENLAKVVRNDDELASLLLGNRPDVLHATTAAMDLALHRFAIACTARSERTGEFIHLMATRFRYTRGTKLRREGFGPEIIAWLLDHSNTQSSKIYTENTAQEAVIIDELVGPKLAPFAQACLGTLVHSERDAIRGNDPGSRVPNHVQHPIGTCGNYGFCASGFKACYTCRFFQPWVDGPHEEVLHELYAEKERARLAGCAEVVVNADDRLILAVEDCVARCNAAKEELTVVDAPQEVAHG